MLPLLQSNQRFLATLPSIGHVALGAVALAIAVLLFRIYYALFLSPLKDIPGPFLARFTRLWEFSIVCQGTFHDKIIKLHSQYGPIVRISPNVYSFNSLDDQKKIYRLKDDFSKTAFYTPSGHPDFPNIFGAVDKTFHANRRRTLASLYSMSSMVKYEDAVDRTNEICIRKLSEFAETQERVLLTQFLQFYAFEVIGEISIGRNFGMLENNRDVDNLLHTAREATKYAGISGVMPEWHRLIVRAMNALGKSLGGLVLTEVASDTLAEYSEDPDIQEDHDRPEPFVSRLLRLEAQGKAKRADSLDSIGANFAAGAHTTGVTLAAVLHFLFRHSHALQRLRREIDDMSAAGKISDPVTFKEAQEMPYLQAVVAETLRLNGAVAYILPRAVPVGGVELSGKHFPEGTTVGVSPWALHYNKDVFGENAAEFRPERFLQGGGDATTSAAHLGNSFAFGGGTRSCIGKNISLLEMTKLIPQVVRQYDVVLESDKPQEISTHFLVFTEYYCRIEHRREARESLASTQQTRSVLRRNSESIK